MKLKKKKNIEFSIPPEHPYYPIPYPTVTHPHNDTNDRCRQYVRRLTHEDDDDESTKLVVIQISAANSEHLV